MAGPRFETRYTTNLLPQRAGLGGVQNTLKNQGTAKTFLSRLWGKGISPTAQVTKLTGTTEISTSHTVANITTSVVNAAGTSARLEAMTDAMKAGKDPFDLSITDLFSRAKAKISDFISSNFPKGTNINFAARLTLFTTVSAFILSLSGCSEVAEASVQLVPAFDAIKDHLLYVTSAVSLVGLGAKAVNLYRGVESKTLKALEKLILPGLAFTALFSDFGSSAAKGTIEVVKNLFTFENRDLGYATVLSVLTYLGLKSNSERMTTDPHSLNGKIWDTFDRLAPGIILTDMIFLIKVSYMSDANPTDIFLSFGSNVTSLMKALPLAFVVAKTLRDVKNGLRTRMSSENPPTVAGAVVAQVLPDIAIPLIATYLIYRTSMFGSMLARGISDMGPAAYLMAALYGLGLYRKYEQSGKAIKDNNRLFDILTSKPVLFASFSALAFIDFHSALYLLTDLVATKALFADFHSGLPAAGLGWNMKRSALGQKGRSVSDQKIERTQTRKDRVISMINPFIKPWEVNIAQIFKALTNNVASLQHNLLVEQKPMLSGDEGLKSVRALRSTRDLLSFIDSEIQLNIRDWFRGGKDEMMDSLSDMIESGKVDSEEALALIRAEYAHLAEKLEGLGERFMRDIEEELDPATNRPDRFVRIIKDYLKADRSALASHKKEGVDRLFEDQYLPEYEQNMMLVLKYRGDEMVERARRLRTRMEKFPDTATIPELWDLYEFYMRIFSVPFNLIARRERFEDDQINQKTNNVAIVFTHWGDTIYKTWLLDNSTAPHTMQVGWVPSLYIKIANPDYEFSPSSPKHLWVHRDNFAKELIHSRSASDHIRFVDNTPSEKQLEEDMIEVTINGRTVSAMPAYDDAPLPSRGIIFYGNTPEEKAKNRQHVKGKLLWVCGSQMPKGFDKAFEGWATQRYEKFGRDYIKWRDGVREKEGNNSAIWWEDSPSHFALVGSTGFPQSIFIMNDEEHMGYNSPSVLPTALEHDAENNLVLRILYYDKLKRPQEFPNPLPGQTPTEIDLVDSFITLKYSTKDGKQLELPYQFNKLFFPKPNLGGFPIDWKQIKTAKPYVDENGQPQLALIFSLDDEKLVPLETVYSPYLPHPSMIDGNIEMNVFSDPFRVGSVTSLMAIYPGKESAPLHETVRFKLLTESPGQFWPNLIPKGGITTSADGKTIKAMYFYPLVAKAFPMPEGWFQKKVEKASLPNVRDIDNSGEVYIAKLSGNTDHTWAPRADAFPEKIETGSVRKFSGTIALFEYTDENGTLRETIVPAPLSGELAKPHSARSTIEARMVSEDEMEVIKGVRSPAMKEDIPSFLYELKPNNELAVPEISWITDVRIEQKKGSQEFVVRVRWENPNNANNTGELVIPGDKFYDKRKKDLLSNLDYSMTSISSIYQRDAADGNTNYPRDTGRYSPRIESRNGQVYLVVTPVERKRVKISQALRAMMPKDLGRVTTIQIARPTSAALLREGSGENAQDRWIPLSLTDPISHLAMAYIGSEEDKK